MHGPVQHPLKYNLGRENPIGGPPDETQADAVCCDPNDKPYVSLCQPAQTMAALRTYVLVLGATPLASATYVQIGTNKRFFAPKKKQPVGLYSKF